MKARSWHGRRLAAGGNRFPVEKPSDDAGILRNSADGDHSCDEAVTTALGSEIDGPGDGSTGHEVILEKTKTVVDRLRVADLPRRDKQFKNEDRSGARGPGPSTKFRIHTGDAGSVSLLRAVEQ